MSVVQGLLACLLALSPARSTEPPASSSSTRPIPSDPGVLPAELERLARSLRHQDVVSRIEAVSALLLETPYLDDPIGEGTAPDDDFLARYDAFDCLTFVEEVMALTMPTDPANAGEVRRSLRYGEQVDYASRHHFMELQWIPSAIERGWIRDTTASYGEVETFTQSVTATTWTQWSGRQRFAMPDDALPIGEMRLSIIPLASAREQSQDFRPGSILMTVRRPRPGVPIWITHLGWILERDGRTILRHASRMASSRKVRDHDLAWYLGHLETYTRWPVAGVAIFEPIEVGPRAGTTVDGAPPQP